MSGAPIFGRGQGLNTDDRLRSWTSRLRTGSAVSRSDAVLDPIELGAVDSAFGFAAEHARRYVATNGEDDGWDGPRPILLLYTKGRRSGQVRRAPVLYHDDRGERLIVASRGGHPAHPAWFLNILDERDVHVRVNATFYTARAELLAGDERVDAWSSLTQAHPVFIEYQAAVSRLLPVLRLLPQPIEARS